MYVTVDVFDIRNVPSLFVLSLPQEVELNDGKNQSDTLSCELLKVPTINNLQLKTRREAKSG